MNFRTLLLFLLVLNYVERIVLQLSYLTGQGPANKNSSVREYSGECSWYETESKYVLISILSWETFEVLFMIL